VDESGGWASPWLVQGCVKAMLCVRGVRVLFWCWGGGDEVIRG